nr:MAG TPA: hypothetical protein [Caudoviricetes sp.]
MSVNNLLKSKIVGRFAARSNETAPKIRIILISI